MSGKFLRLQIRFISSDLRGFARGVAGTAELESPRVSFQKDSLMLLPSVAELPEYKGVLDALMAQARLERKSFDRDQLARRMGIVAAAGVTDPDEFKRQVLRR